MVLGIFRVADQKYHRQNDIIISRLKILWSEKIKFKGDFRDFFEFS